VEKNSGEKQQQKTDTQTEMEIKQYFCGLCLIAVN